MPLNSPSAPETLYPINDLNRITNPDLTSLLPSYKQAWDQSDQAIKSTNKFIALDLDEDNKANSSDKNKRKFVCLELSSAKKRIIKKYDHKSYEESERSKKTKNGKKLLTFYIRSQQMDSFLEEIETLVNESFDLNPDELIKKIKDHFIMIWKNFKTFNSYSEMKHAYDDKTGEYIHNSVNDLGKSYMEIEKKFNELNVGRDVSEGCNQILNEMQEIISKMKEIFDKNQNEFQHLSTNTVTPVAQAFKELISKFNEKERKLEIEKTKVENNKKLESLIKAVEELKKDCGAVIPNGALGTEKMFNEKKEIESDIKALLSSISALRNSVISGDVIEGQEKKFHNIKEKLNLFKKEVDQLIESLKEDKKLKEDNKLQEMEKYFSEKIEPILKEIETHSENTTQGKASILKKILDFLVKLKDKLIAKADVKDINKFIVELKEFIRTKAEDLAVKQGFFRNPKSPGLVEKLNSNLDYLIQSDDVQEQNLASPKP